MTDAGLAHLAGLKSLYTINLSETRVTGTGLTYLQGFEDLNHVYFCIEEQADHTMALLLALARKLPQMGKALAAGAYREARESARTNQRLESRTLGLVGFGNSAKAVATRAAGFGMRVTVGDAIGIHE